MRADGECTSPNHRRATALLDVGFSFAMRPSGGFAAVGFVIIEPPETRRRRDEELRVVGVARDAACDTVRSACARRRQDQRSRLRPQRRRHGRDHRRLLERRDHDDAQRRRQRQPAAERADSRGRPKQRAPHERGRQRLLPHRHQRRHLGRLLLLVGRRGELDEQSPARLPDRHLGRRAGLAASRIGQRRWRSGPGLGQRRASLLRRHRVQPRQAGQRLDLDRTLRLAARGHDAGLRVHDARLAWDAEPDLPRPLRGQGPARGRQGGDEPAFGQRLPLLGALHRKRGEQLRRIRALDRRRANVQRFRRSPRVCTAASSAISR